MRIFIQDTKFNITLTLNIFIMDELINFTIPIFSGRFGEKYAPSEPSDKSRYTPNWFSHIFEGNLSKHGCPIFSTLPQELLPYITQHLSKKDMHNLLQVDRTFCQLARSCLFSNICLDFTVKTRELMLLIWSSQALNAKTNHPPLGACIRKLVIQTDSEFFIQATNIDYNDYDVKDEESIDLLRQRSKEACNTFEAYLKSISQLLPLLINLRAFECRDRTVIKDFLLRAVLSLPFLESIYMHRSVFDLAAPPIKEEDIKCNLRHIHLVPSTSFEMMRKSKEAQHPTQNAVNIVAKSIGTVETLTIGLHNVGKIQDSTDFSSLEDCSFPRLRDLHINYKLPTSVFNSLINRSPKLQTLSFTMTECLEWLNDHCTATGLRTLNLKYCHHAQKEREDGVPYEMVKKQSELKQLVLAEQMEPEILSRLCPILNEYNPKLEGLLLYFTTPPSAEQWSQLGTLKDLSKLHVSAGSRYGWQHDWQINHLEIKNALYPLKKLKWLAFERDSYDLLDMPFRDDYYTYMKIEHYSKDHLKRMKAIAENYSRTFPRLKTIFVGKLLFTIKRGPEWARIKPEFTTVRDCSEYLNNSWNLDYS